MLSGYRQLSRNTTALAVSIGLVLLTWFAWNPLLPLHLRALGATDIEIGAIFSMLIFAHSIPAVVGGMLADRFGRKWVVIAPGLLLVPFYVWGGLTTDWRLLALLLILSNAASGLQWPAMQALISESDEASRAAAFSMIEVFVLSASVLGPLLGSLVLPYLGLSGLIILNGLALLPASWLRAVALTETHAPRKDRVRPTANRRQALSPAATWIIVSYALFALVLGLTIQGPFVAILARDAWSLTDQQVQQLTAVASLAAFGGIWLGGKADRWGGRRMWIVTALVFAACLAGWGLSPNVFVGAAFAMGSSLCLEGLFIISETLLAQHTTRDTRSFLFGLLGTAGGFTEAGGPALGGALVALTRISAPFLAGAFVSLLSVLTIVPVEKARPAEASSAAPAD